MAKPPLPPQLYVDSRSPAKPLDTSHGIVVVREGGERP
jgi:hypothetical protein